jgi:hypothetical protein
LKAIRVQRMNCAAPRHALAIACAFFVFSETSDEPLILAENATWSAVTTGSSMTFQPRYRE